MNEKQLLKSLVDICEIAHVISMEIDNMSCEVEGLSTMIENLFTEINPIKYTGEDWDSWTNYMEATKKYIKQETN
jgi:hypothetical protein